MKKYILPGLLCVLLCGLVFLSGCHKTSVSAPAHLRVDALTLDLQWDAFSDAAYYTVSLAGPSETVEKQTSKNLYSLETLSAGDYKIKVKAVVTQEGGELTDSDWSEEIAFTREQESGLAFQLINHNTAFEVASIGTAQGNITVPDTYRGLPVIRVGDKAFYNRSALTGIVLGDNILEIGEQAFTNCSYLTSFTLPTHLRSIGDKAFQSCRALEGGVILSDSVTEIGEQVFEYCRRISVLQIGNGLREIPASAFGSCDMLTAVAIPDNVLSIGEGAFAKCYALASLQIGNGVREIGKEAFLQCRALENLELGESVTLIGESAFSGCTALVSVNMADHVEDIGANAFAGCSKLNEVRRLSAAVKRIQDGAFAGTAIWNNAANEVYVGQWFIGSRIADMRQGSVRAGTVGIADYAFRGCAAFPDILTLPNSVHTLGEGAFAGCTTLVNVVLGSGLKEVGRYAFYGCTGLTNALLCAYDAAADGFIGASTLERIGDNAFFGCSRLQSISIPESVTSIGSYAFRDSGIWTAAQDPLYAGVYADKWLVGATEIGFGYLIVKEGTVGISNYAFYGNQQLTGVIIDDSVRYIGRGAFYGCSNLSDAFLPKDLKVIEDYTFYRCVSLEMPDDPANLLPQSLTCIGRSAFYMCPLASPDDNNGNLEVVIPPSVKSIGDYAFYHCYGTAVRKDEAGNEMEVLYGMSTLHTGHGVETVGDHAFSGIVTLTTAYIGNHVKAIGEKAFYKCEKLESVRFGDALQTIGNKAFYACSSLSGVQLPDTVRLIGNYAFYRCTALASLTLGGATSIGDYAFCGCSALTGLYLPATLERIGAQAFRNCTGLGGITLHGGITAVGAHAFYGCKNATFYVEGTEPGVAWHTYWNSSYRPVLWGCTVTDGYVTGFTKAPGRVTYKNSTNHVAAPARAGYTFAGFATAPDTDTVLYAPDAFDTIPEGAVLYAVWVAVSV